MAERPFGPYQLVRQIAVGGMAEIHLAKTHGLAGFEKFCALKMIHPNFAQDETFIEMLIDEAKIAVRDRFGRLAKNTILAYIEKCLHSPVQIDRKTYGAGLGLYLVANAAASYLVNVAYGIATEVVCTFDRGAKAPLRMVGMFVHPGQAELLREGPTPENAAGQEPEHVELDVDSHP